jgi:hypothetical protein
VGTWNVMDFSSSGMRSGHGSLVGPAGFKVSMGGGGGGG